MQLPEQAERLGRRLRWGNWLTQLVVTRRCNLACGYCNEFDKTSAPVPLETLKACVSHLHSLGTFTLTLTGGEPLLHPQLVEVLAHARAVGIPRRTMITNGFLLTEDIVERLNEVELRGMQISVDGVKRRPITEKVLDNLHKRLELLARRARFRVTMGVVVGSTSVAESRELIAFARGHGFEVNLNLLHDQSGQLQLDPSLLDDYRQLVEEVHGRAYDLEGDYRWRMVHGHDADFRCRAGARYLYIDEFQQVCWCSQTRDTGPRRPLLEYTWEDMRQAFFTEKSCSRRCTVGCVRRVSRLDDWRPIGEATYRFSTSLLTEAVTQVRRRLKDG